MKGAPENRHPARRNVRRDFASTILPLFSTAPDDLKFVWGFFQAIIDSFRYEPPDTLVQNAKCSSASVAAQLPLQVVSALAQGFKIL